MSALKNFLENFIPSITSDEIEELDTYWNIRRKIKRHEWLTAPGKKDTHLYFIEEGTFKICYEIEGEEVILGFGYPDTLLVDFPSFISETPSEFYIQALKAAKIVGIKKSDFNSFIKSQPSLSDFWRLTLERATLELIEREIDLLTPSPQVRFDRLMKRSPNVFQHIPNRHIASYLRMTPETLSRLKKH